MARLLVDNIAVTSRIRLARNIVNMPFVNTDEESSNELISAVANTLMNMGNFKVYKMDSVSDIDSKVMLEKNLITKELQTNKSSGAVVIRADEFVSVMINEEDHIREQVLIPGLALEKAYTLINEIDDELSDKLEFAYDESLGYLTSNVSNVGTGLKASVVLFLPALTLSSQIEKVINSVKSKGLIVNGFGGVGSSSVGYLYQLSNNVSIGNSEREIISMVSSAVNRIIELEIEARQQMLENNLDFVMDLSWRSYGVLSNCYSIDYMEFMKLAGEVKLGISLGVIVLTDNKFIDKLVDYCSSGAIIKQARKNLTEEEICKFRAEQLRKSLKNFRIK